MYQELSSAEKKLRLPLMVAFSGYVSLAAQNRDRAELGKWVKAESNTIFIHGVGS